MLGIAVTINAPLADGLSVPCTIIGLPTDKPCSVVVVTLIISLEFVLVIAESDIDVSPLRL